MNYDNCQSAQDHNNVLFEKFRSLNIPIGEYAIVSSGPLAIREIRRANDIDVIVTSDLWKKLKNRFGDIYCGPHNIKLITPVSNVDFFCPESLKKLQDNLPESGPTTEEQIKNAEVIAGLSFQSLRDCLWFKKHQAREKDIVDIALTKEYLKNHPTEMARIDYKL